MDPLYLNIQYIYIYIFCFVFWMIAIYSPQYVTDPRVSSLHPTRSKKKFTGRRKEILHGEVKVGWTCGDIHLAIW